MKKHYAFFLLFFATILNITASNKIYATKLHSNYIFKVNNNTYNTSSFYIANGYNDILHPLSINDVDFPLTINPLTIPNLKVNQTADHTFSHLVSNTKKSPAKSYVWVDFDNNGIFTADEAVVTTIPANALNFKVNINYPNANFIDKLKIGVLNIKFTTTTTTLVDNALTPNFDERSTNLGIDGETELFSQKSILGITISESVGITKAKRDEIEIPFNKLKSFILDSFANDKVCIRKQSVNKPSILLIDSLRKRVTTKVLLKNNAIKETEKLAVIKFKVKPKGVNDVRVLNAEHARHTSSVTLNILSNDNLSDKLPVTFETLVPPSNVKDLVVNLTTGDITFILPDTQIIPNYYTYTYRLKTLDGVYSDPITATVYTAFSPSITLNKTPDFNDINNDGLAQAGETITYTFPTKNTGNVDIENAVVTDLKIGLKAPVLPKLLKPGESGAISIVPKIYVITAADVLAGRVSNTATVSAIEPITNTVVTDTSSAIVIFPILKIELVKSSTVIDLNGNCTVDAGDKIQYTFTVTNKGTVDVFSIVINDPKINLVNQPISPSSLAPGKSGALTAINTYTITQADIINGIVSNKSIAQGKNLQNTLVTAEAQNLITIGQSIQNCGGGGGNPKISLVKKSLVVDINKNSVNDFGDRIDYIFTVTNTGNVTIKNISITDNFANVTGGPIATLAPNRVDSTTFKASYTITQADVDKGSISNTAIAKGFDPKNISVSDTSGTTNENNSSTITPIKQQGKISLIKKVTNKGTGVNGAFLLGDIIIYSFTIINTGNVTLKNLVLTDPLFVNPNIDLSSTTLLPNATINVVANYRVTAANIEAGVVINQALVTSLDPKNIIVQDYSGSTSDTDDKTITSLVDGFFIPNVFTPNGDGINDTFEIVGLLNYTSVEIEVFNRWGNQVYKNLNYQNQWLAEGLNEGTYYYIIKLKTLTDSKTLKGWVLIKR